MSNLDWKELNLRYVRIDVLLDKENTKIYRVKDSITNDICVMKIRKGRDLTGIYRQMEKIHHPNLPEIYEVVYDGSDTVIVEEYVAGEGLNAQIRRQVLTEEETIHIILQLCDALTVIHTQKPVIIHRDIKASNVMIKPDGLVKLIDFDAARNYHEEQERDTQQMGTLEYASPEHFGYAQTDEKSDIYSVGVLMHEMLTGETFSQEDVLYKGKLRHIIRKCTRVKADRRYRTARHLKRKLYSYYHYRKRRIAAVVLTLSVFVLVTGVTVRHYQQKRVQQEKDEGKKVIELSEKEAFEKRFEVYHSENGNVLDILKDEYVVDEMNRILGLRTTWFVNNFDEVKSNYDEDEEMLVIIGQRPYRYYHRTNELCSVIAIRKNGNIQFAYTNAEGIDDWLILFGTNAKEEYHKIPVEVFAWIIDKYILEYKQLVTEEDLERYPDINVENGVVIPEGDYVLRSAFGATGRIHVSFQSNKKDPDKKKWYHIQGAIQRNGKERKIDLEMNPWYASNWDETPYTTIYMGAFYDSVFLCEYYNGDKYDIPYEIPITGQFIKERGH